MALQTPGESPNPTRPPGGHRGAAFAAVSAGLVTALFGLALGAVGPSTSSYQTCSSLGTAEINGTEYAICTVSINWGFWGLQYPRTSPIHLNVDGVLFNVYGYATIDCPVVNVTGQEPNGSSYSFLIYPTPLGCIFDRPTVFSADGEFGATWTGGSSLELLVRAG